MCKILHIKLSVIVFLYDHYFFVLPPYLDEELTSSDKDVREGTDVSLRCVAKGSPEPEVTWRREDGQEISIGKSKVTNVRGSYLNITKVSRLHMGAYLCIASNGVAPSLSKRILLGVSYEEIVQPVPHTQIAFERCYQGCLQDMKCLHEQFDDICCRMDSQFGDQINLGSVYIIKMGASVFGGFVMNENWQRAFIIAMLAHHLT
ncbi:lachesin [Trichonephila clavipes]|uniref:Lachesin n=1 Tax=Trichonephila clavipes TaxID=2585209 RepID=A0A8X6T2T3_TRICX|nr:lachesin [Trichonephila clavipes]